MGLFDALKPEPRIYDVLTAEHREVDGLFAAIEAAEPGEERRKLFDRLRTELDAHARAEQDVFYAAIIDDEPTHDLTLEAREEHRLVLRLLKEIDALAGDNDLWMAKVQVLKELVRHHVKEEERQLFKRARSVLSDEEALEMVDEYRAAKRRHQPKPSRRDQQPGA